MSSTDRNSGDLPKRDVGATLDPVDRAELIVKRESIRAAYEDKDGNSQ